VNDNNKMEKLLTIWQRSRHRGQK